MIISLVIALIFFVIISSLVFIHLINKSGSKIRRYRIVFQLAFMLIVIAATINSHLIKIGKNFYSYTDSFFHYVCPVCGVTTITQYLNSDIGILDKLNNSVTTVLFFMILLTFLLGPFFCGWLCPFGFFQEMIRTLAKKLNINAISTNQNSNPDKKLRFLRYLFLLIVILLTLVNGTRFLEQINPYHSYLSLFTGVISILGLAVLILIVYMSLYTQRPWCKYFCPYGALLGLSNVFKLIKIKRNEITCINCKRCDNICPMSLNVSSSTSVSNHQCISCLECTSNAVCPINNTVNFTFVLNKGLILKKNSLGFMSSIMAVIIIFAGSINTILNNNQSDTLDAYYEQPASLNNTLTSHPTPNNNTNNDTSPNKDINKDNINTTKNNNISNDSIKTTSKANKNIPDLNNTKQKNLSQKHTIKKQPIKKQPLTKSSGNNVIVKKNPPTMTPTPKKSIYKDGRYIISTTGYSPGLKVSVVILNDRITEITILQHNETPGFFEEPFSIIPEKIIKTQSTNVDTVSGATFSSLGVINAVKKALLLSSTKL